MKPGAKVCVVDLEEPAFILLLRTRTPDIVFRKPRTACDMVFLGAQKPADLKRLSVLKTWIEPDGAIWVIRPKGGRSALRDIDVIEAGLAAGLVDNKIASFSETHGAMRLVFRLRDRPR